MTSPQPPPSNSTNVSSRSPATAIGANAEEICNTDPTDAEEALRDASIAQRIKDKIVGVAATKSTARKR